MYMSILVLLFFNPFCMFVCIVAAKFNLFVNVFRVDSE